MPTDLIRTLEPATRLPQGQPAGVSDRLRNLLRTATRVEVAAPAGTAGTDALLRRTAAAFAAAAGLSLAMHGPEAVAQTTASALQPASQQVQLSLEDAALEMAQAQLGLGMSVRRTFDETAPIGAQYELGGRSCRVNLYDRYWESPQVRHLAQAAGWDDEDARAFVSAHEAQHCVTGFHAAGNRGRDRAQAYAEVLFGGQAALRHLAERLQVKEPLARVISLRTNTVTSRQEAISDLVGLAAVQRSRAERGLSAMTPEQVEALAEVRATELSHDTSQALRALAEDMRYSGAAFPAGVSNMRTVVDYAVDIVLEQLDADETDRIERQALMSAITQISGAVAGGSPNAAGLGPDKALQAAVDVLQDNLQRGSTSRLGAQEARLASSELRGARQELQAATAVTAEVVRLRDRLQQMAEMLQGHSEATAPQDCGPAADGDPLPDCPRERMR